MNDQKVPFNQRKNLAQSFKFLIHKSLEKLDKPSSKLNINVLEDKKDKYSSKDLKRFGYNIFDKKENIMAIRNEGHFLQNCLNNMINKNIPKENKLNLYELEDTIMNANFNDFRENYFKKIKANKKGSPVFGVKKKVNSAGNRYTTDEGSNMSIADILATPKRKQKNKFNTMGFSIGIPSLEREALLSNRTKFEGSATLSSRRRSTPKVETKASALKVDVHKMNEKDKLVDESNESLDVVSQERYLIPKQIQPRDKFRLLQRKNLIYDSRSEEEVEWNEATHFLIHPRSRFKEVWDIIIFTMTFYNIIYVPYTMAFIEEAGQYQVTLDLLSDLLFILDLVFQFFIPFKMKTPDDKFITSYSGIALKYIFGWFFLDFIASVPINSVINVLQIIETDGPANISAISNIAKLSRIYRIMKLLRLLKVIKIVQDDEKSIFHDKIDIVDQYNCSMTTRRLILFILYFFVLNHMLACIWVFLGTLNYPNWIIVNGLADSSNIDLYIASLYFNLVTIFTIGYGDISPTNIYEFSYNVVVLLLGISTYTYALSSISYIIQTVDERTVIYNKNMDYLEDIKMKYKIPMGLYRRILRFLKYDYSVNKTDNYILLDDLPMVLKTDLINTMYKDMLLHFKFFKLTQNADFNNRIVACLRPLKAVRSDILIQEGDHIEELIFVKRGILNIEKTYKGHLIKVLEIRKNEHYGEIEMLLNKECNFTIKVKSRVCELYLIKKTDLIDIGCEFQETFEIITQRSSYNLLQMTNLVHNIQSKFDEEQNRIESQHRKTKMMTLYSDESLDHDEQKNQEIIDKELMSLIDDLSKKTELAENHQNNIDMKISQLVINANQMKNALGRNSLSLMQYRRQSHIEPNSGLAASLGVEPRSPEKMKKRYSSEHNFMVRKSFGSMKATVNDKRLQLNQVGSIKAVSVHNSKKTVMEKNDVFQKLLGTKDLRRDSFLLNYEINRNLHDSSLNLKDPKSFYSKFIQRSKVQRDQNENDKVSRKLDNLIKLFN
jgi:hypothetical protein